MSNLIHTLHRGYDGRYYAFGSERSYSFFDGRQASYLLYDGSFNFDGSEDFSAGGYTVDPLEKLWLIGHPTLESTRDDTLDVKLYDLFIEGQWELSYGAAFLIQITSADTFKWKLETDALWSREYRIRAGDRYPLKYGMELHFGASTGFVAGTQWRFTITEFNTAQDKTLSCVNYDGHTYISGPSLQLHKVFGSSVIEITNSSKLKKLLQKLFSMKDLTADYMFEWFSHLVMVKNNIVFWSDVNDFGTWHPEPTNEADFRELSWESENATGVGVLGDSHFVHFPTAIYRCDYVGKPNGTMVLRRVVKNVGCAVPRGLITCQGLQYFIGLEGFYVFDGQSNPVLIDEAIWAFFIEEVNLDYFLDIWAFYDQENQEVGWAFKSNFGFSETTENRYLSYSLRQKTWHFGSLENVKSHITMVHPDNHRDIGNDSEVIEEDDGLINPTEGYRLRNLWGGEDRILIDTNNTDRIADMLAMTEPLWETHDFVYDNIHTLKDNDMVVIDADYDANCVGIDVYVSVRNFLSEDVEWDLVGRWTKDLKHKMLTYPIRAGKVFRFRFVPIAGENGFRSLTFSAWGERILMANKDTVFGS